MRRGGEEGRTNGLMEGSSEEVFSFVPGVDSSEAPGFPADSASGCSFWPWLQPLG